MIRVEEFSAGATKMLIFCWIKSFFFSVSNRTEETSLKSLSAKCEKIEIKVQVFFRRQQKFKKNNLGYW